MIGPRDVYETLAQLKTILDEYWAKVADLKYDQTRFDEAVEAIHALGYDRSDARHWLTIKVVKR